MTTGTLVPRQPAAAAGRKGFWQLVRAEWTKFRTVRGWVIAMIAAIMAVIAFVFLASDVGSSCVQSGAAGPSACPSPPIGPGGEPVQDTFYFVHQPLTGNGTITVRMTSLTGQVTAGGRGGSPTRTAPHLDPWSKAGIIIKENTAQGSAYAAMMATGAHGVRMQWNYIDDTPGMTGSVSMSSPRWLRLVRTGDTITGYDSTDGARWTQVGTATLPKLTSTVQAGLFAASPNNGNRATATGIFDDIELSWPTTGWAGTNVGDSGANGVAVPGAFRQGDGTLTVTGSGDIAPLAGAGVISIQRALIGTFLGLILVIVVGAMFITAEYRRGLIRISLTASPRRGTLLAAKAVVIGAVSFVTGLIAAALAVALGTHTLPRSDVPLWPVSALTEARMIVGTATTLAVAAVLALAIGTILRRSAPTITAVIALIFIPYLLAAHGPGNGGAGEWLLRITPAAALSVQQAVSQFPQVDASYTSGDGYYPLSPWAGLAVECAWAAAALILASYLLRRRDA